MVSHPSRSIRKRSENTTYQSMEVLGKAIHAFCRLAKCQLSNVFGFEQPLGRCRTVGVSRLVGFCISFSSTATVQVYHGGAIVLLPLFTSSSWLLQFFFNSSVCRSGLAGL